MYTQPFIAITNHSTVLPDEEVADAAPAIQRATTYHFRPHWGSGASVHFMPRGADVPAGAWVFAITDTSDQAGALAYHDIDGNAAPTASIFAATEQEAGASWTVSLTHELWEALVDPVCLACAQISDTHVVAYETADPVEADTLGFAVTSPAGSRILMSDFVYPAWFVPGAPGPWDYAHALDGPLTLAEGGYVSVGEATARGIRWSQVQARGGNLAAGVPEGSLAERQGDAYRIATRGQRGAYLEDFVHRLPGRRVQVVGEAGPIGLRAMA